MIDDFLEIFSFSLTPDKALLFWFLLRFIMLPVIKYAIIKLKSLGGKI